MKYWYVNTLHENIMLNDRSQSQKAKYFVSPFI